MVRAAPTEEPDLRPLGLEVRQHRHRLGLTIKELSSSSGLSPRFLSDLELGRGNISIGRLVQIARALHVPISALVAPLDRTQRARTEPVALVGLRGAGKSTIGARLASELGVPFLELDREVEAAAALPIAQIFEIHGEAYYRRLEREVLTKALSRSGGVVIATGGGLVSHDESWRLLKRSARTVWLKAKPEDHYARVMAQGDLRPMKNRPAAMAELRALLTSREPRYADADLSVDTSSQNIDTSVSRILRWAEGDREA